MGIKRDGKNYVITYKGVTMEVTIEVREGKRTYFLFQNRAPFVMAGYTGGLTAFFDYLKTLPNNFSPLSIDSGYGKDAPSVVSFKDETVNKGFAQFLGLPAENAAGWVTCTSCGTENPEKNTHCISCNAPLKH